VLAASATEKKILAITTLRNPLKIIGAPCRHEALIANTRSRPMPQFTSSLSKFSRLGQNPAIELADIGIQRNKFALKDGLVDRVNLFQYTRIILTSNYFVSRCFP